MELLRLSCGHLDCFGIWIGDVAIRANQLPRGNRPEKSLGHEGARYPLDLLKIDRSIAASVEEDPAAASIVSAVVTLGRSLGLGIVAEGVDSIGQARMVTQLGCDELQGFLVSPAVEASEFEEIYRGWQGLEQCKDVEASDPSFGDPEDSQDLPVSVDE